MVLFVSETVPRGCFGAFLWFCVANVLLGQRLLGSEHFARGAIKQMQILLWKALWESSESLLFAGCSCRLGGSHAMAAS